MKKYKNLNKQEFVIYAIFRPKTAAAAEEDKRHSEEYANPTPPISASPVERQLKSKSKRTKKATPTSPEDEALNNIDVEAFADDHDLVGLVLSRNEVEEFIDVFLQKSHHGSYVEWCQENNKEQEKEDNWIEYAETFVSEDDPNNRFVVVDWVFSSSTIAGILRTFFRLEPLGCSYETEDEIRHFNQNLLTDLLSTIPPGSDDEEDLKDSLHEALNSPAGQRLISSLADALFGSPEEEDLKSEPKNNKA